MMGGHIGLTLLWTVVCVALILGLAYWVTRFVGTHSMGLPGRGKGNEQLTVLARLSLGKEQQLAVVQAGTRYFLLGVTAGQMSVLTEFTQEEAACWQTEQAAAPAAAVPADFRNLLRTALQQKGPR